MVTATDLRAGKKTKRLEAAIEEGLDRAITELAQELAGPGGSPRTFRSEAVRVLIAAGVEARRRGRAA